MPQLQQYTAQNSPNQLLNTRRADASDIHPTEALSGLGETITAVTEKRQNRIDTINRIRLMDQFYNDVFNEFNRVQSEEDLVDPATAEKFNYQIRQKASEYISKYQGSPDGKASFEAGVLDNMGRFTRQMTQNSIGAQRGFLMKKAGAQINDLAQQARQNPEMLGEIFKRADVLLSDMSPALFPEDELDLTSAAHEAITLNALYSYTDSGQYEEARALIDENPLFMQSLSPDSQRRILAEIQGGIADKEKTQKETRDKINTIRSAAEELGVDLDGYQVFEAATGLDASSAPDKKVEEFARLTNQKAENLPVSVIAKIGYGVDLPGSDIDFNKEYLPDGGLTPKGIGGQVKEPFEKAAAAKMYQDKVLGAIGLFRNDGNRQALLSAMISFQKALDEGAIVREGDIVLQREAQGLSDRISLLLKPGQVVGDELVDEMEATINDFTSKALSGAKAQIDPYIEDAQSRGYRPLDYGLPTEAYEQVFGRVRAPEKKRGASKNTMTADEFLQQ